MNVDDIMPLFNKYQEYDKLNRLVHESIEVFNKAMTYDKVEYSSWIKGLEHFIFLRDQEKRKLFKQCMSYFKETKEMTSDELKDKVFQLVHLYRQRDIIETSKHWEPNVDQRIEEIN